ncbi:hypothetical protein [Pseudoxanthomonas sp.]|uniref:hypothetical protein n=1 Tax=Pseudoxanthomonas sp. TaxID=1871049 RepID=UPI0028C50227|nr:hypothetical protein [Pseudoxanthomonas sp.]
MVAEPTSARLRAWLPALMLASAPVLADEATVPLLSRSEVAVLGGASARMIDDSTCEVVSPVTYGKGQVVAGANVALYRAGKRKPFMHAVTREDGVYVARFSAKPNEIVYGRAYRVEPQTGAVSFGNAARMVCALATVSVGEVNSVDQIEDSDSAKD